MQTSVPKLPVNHRKLASMYRTKKASAKNYARNTICDNQFFGKQLRATALCFISFLTATIHKNNNMKAIKL